MKHMVRIIIKACNLYLKMEQSLERRVYEVVAGEPWPEEWC